MAEVTVRAAVITCSDSVAAGRHTDESGALAVIALRFEGFAVEDPIAVIAMAERMVSLRPTTSLVRLGGVGHWPSLECPDRLAAEIVAATGRTR